MTRGDGLAVTIGVLVMAGGLAAGCGGGADVMRATLTAEGCTYEGDTTPVPGVFTVEVRNETHNAAEFMIAEMVDGAKIEEIEPWYEDARRSYPGKYTTPMPMKPPFTSTRVAAGATGEVPVNESSGRYVVLCTLDAGSSGGGVFGSRLFAATELNVQPSS